MKIAVIGAGAMGSIYGGHLALHNEVYLVDTNPEVVRTINEQALRAIYKASCLRSLFFVRC